MSNNSRFEPKTRPVIYQLMVRTFGNTNETRKPHGTLAENGCGKFADLTSTALDSLKEMGFTHLWLTGVLEQASGTAYPGRPADDPDILKGIAGSPYAIRDCFDVCPDYSMNPDKRLDEFRVLLERCKQHDFKVIIDFVPNHVARSYQSDVRPDLSFGAGDERRVFFSRDNHFYYLQADHPGGGPPLKLPTAGNPGCDGLFGPESGFGRVTGNNVVSWAPSIHDWYETVKLNYGHDFTSGRDTSHLPGPDAAPETVPKTWRTMDEILAYWQQMGVDGFRVDMAHMIPMEFWHWVVRRCRARDPQVFFVAEAYDNDPAKLTDGHVLDELLGAGFDAVYDDPCYDVLEGLYDAGKWANDLDPLTFTGRRFHRSLRYAENHDEVRLANPGEWGGLGMKVGKPVSAVLFGMGQGPLMIYHGQEVGEPACGAEGFAGDNARTSIFDYGSMPEFAKWVNGGRFDGGRLDAEQQELRDWYRRLIRVIRERAFSTGEFYGLNHANKENPDYGRLDNECVSGHWLYAFLRRDSKTGQAFLVVANFHGTANLQGVKIRIPHDAQMFLGLSGYEAWKFSDRLDSAWSAGVARGILEQSGVELPDLAPCTAMLLEITHSKQESDTCAPFGTDPEAFYICGPTGSGKSALALEMARRLNGEIVNADAFQLYRGLEILTASPPEQERSVVKHHLYGVLDASEKTDAGSYMRMAKPVIEEIQSCGKTPIITGGSGLYLKFLTHGPAPLPAGDAKLRAELDARPLEDLVAQLRSLDPVEASRTALQNRRFVSRALEICLLTGQMASGLRDQWEKQTREISASLRGIVIRRTRPDLHARIAVRTRAMLDGGAIEEVAALTHVSTNCEKAIGFREIRALLAGEIDRAACEELINAATRQYAKRQETWFRREKWLKLREF